MAKDEIDLSLIDKRIDVILKNNDNISSEFRELINTSFGRIFTMLGNEDFKRWLDRKNLDSRIKKLIVLSENKTSEYSKNNPTVAGYYTRKTNRVTLIENNENEDVAVHELFHFFTDKNGLFTRFLDEGLTEYMKSLAVGKVTAYSRNVNCIQFLREKIFGDKIIKAYLTGNILEFNQDFFSLINYDGQMKFNDVERFYNNLEIIHEFDSSGTLLRKLKAQNAPQDEIKVATQNRF